MTEWTDGRTERWVDAFLWLPLNDWGITAFLNVCLVHLLLEEAWLGWAWSRDTWTLRRSTVHESQNSRAGPKSRGCYHSTPLCMGWSRVS